MSLIHTPGPSPLTTTPPVASSPTLPQSYPVDSGTNLQKWSENLFQIQFNHSAKK
jgi:hypothetical protein